MLIPTFYKQIDISRVLKNQIQKKFDLNFKFNKKIKYNFFPRPHFVTTESIIQNDIGQISRINKLIIYISLDNLFSLKKIEVKDLIFDNSNFYLNKNNYNFFLNLLNKNFKNGNLTLKNSNIFFRNTEDEVLFINKILKMKYFYNKKELKNMFYSENEIFNIPFSIESFFNENKNKFFYKINFNLMKIKIDNEFFLMKTKQGNLYLLLIMLKGLQNIK